MAVRTGSITIVRHATQLSTDSLRRPIRKSNFLSRVTLAPRIPPAGILTSAMNHTVLAPHDLSLPFRRYSTDLNICFFAVCIWLLKIELIVYIDMKSQLVIQSTVADWIPPALRGCSDGVPVLVRERY